MEFVGLRRKDYSGLLFWGFTLPGMETSSGFAQLVREAGVGGHMAPGLCRQQHPSSALLWLVPLFTRRVKARAQGPPGPVLSDPQPTLQPHCSPGTQPCHPHSVS